MKSSTQVILTMAILIGLISGLYIFSDWFSKTTGYVLGEEERVKLAQCLGGKGIVLFTKSNCQECSDQSEIFGDAAFNLVPKVDCSISNDLCSKLKKIPAWEIGEEFIYGKKTINDLIELSGCEIYPSEES